MKGARGTVDRFRDVIRDKVIPGLADLGFRDRLPGSLAATEAVGVTWLLDAEPATWSNRERVSFAIRWGVHVPGVDEAVGDPAPAIPTVESSIVRGCVGEVAGGPTARWFELRRLPLGVAAVADAALANAVLGAVRAEVLPVLRTLSTPVEVQRHLHANLRTGRGAPSAEELQTIRRIAALSLLLGDRSNAARWLDHLEVRSSATMSPDVVAERLAPIRQLLAS